MGFVVAPQSGYSASESTSNWIFGKFNFWGERKTWRKKKRHQSKDNNKLNPCICTMLGPGFEPRPSW